ncbi:antibiotic biosynthesis monooxygenase family protein [Aestuariibius sp. 2305UL40-4]|uniref:antibiotic biosynthesis monooxygenase family protein n=1 Tax=Aestuariibius violaceus TaxID=3234132 RepID=UPI00345E0AAC
MMKVLALNLAAGTASADVVLINAFEVPDGQREAAIAAWEVSRDFLAEQPGYISTVLHASLSPEARFQLVNVARWESAEAFEAAIAEMRAAGASPQIEGLGINPALYTEIRRD